MPSNRSESAFGIVTKNDDPEKRGRIKVSSAAITGEAETPTELPDWIEPCFDWGWFYVPDVGEEVEIEFTTEDDTGEDTRLQAFLEQPNFRWRGKRAQSAGGDAPAEVPPLLKTNYGKRRGFYTPAGHLLYFDDTPGAEVINIAWRGGETEATKKYAFLTFDKTGSVVLANKTGSMLYMNAESGQVAIVDQHGNTFQTSAAGISLIDRSGGIVKMGENSIQVIGQGNITINASGNVTLQAASVQVAADAIDLGPDAALPAFLGQALAKFDLLKAAFDAHTHPLLPSTAGPYPVVSPGAGPPAAPLPDAVATTSVRAV